MVPLMKTAVKTGIPGSVDWVDSYRFPADMMVLVSAGICRAQGEKWSGAARLKYKAKTGL